VCPLLALAVMGCDLTPDPAPPVQVAPAPHAKEPVSTRPPKPGERVRQHELDSYCTETERPLAFYYHGGRPVERVARRDDCYPLFVADCSGDDTSEPCFAPGDQEPGMWCCHDPSATQQASR
jgi:hypothetical protein